MELSETKKKDDDDDDGDVWDEWTQNEGDLQAVVTISAAQVICLSVSASVKVSQSKGLIRASSDPRGRHISRGVMG